MILVVVGAIDATTDQHVTDCHIVGHDPADLLARSQHGSTTAEQPNALV